MDRPTLRCYAQYYIKKNYIPRILDLINKYSSDFNVLPSVQIGQNFNIDVNIDKNDISILIVKEICATREDQNNWFLRMTRSIVENTLQNILIILFSDIDPNITEERRTYYQSQIPNSTIIYSELDQWLPKNYYYSIQQ